MALLFIDGFDHMGTGNPVTLGKWGSEPSNGFLPSTSNPRTGTHSLLTNGFNAIMITKALPASGGFVVGVAFRFAGALTGALDMLQIMESSTVHLAIGGVVGNKLTVRRGTTTLATGTTVLAINTWYYLEFKGIIHDTTGSYEVKIDGVTEAALTNAGPTDTRNSGTTGQWDRVALLHFAPNVVNDQFDDLYICDQSGSAPDNTFLGSVKVEILYPQTGNGTNVGLTCSTGTDHGALVDETSPNTTDYNSSPTVGLKDTYHYPAMTLTGTVLGVQTNLYMQKSDATARTVCAVVRSAGADSDGANLAPLTTFAYHSPVFAQDPNAGSPIAWTTTSVGNAEFGMKVTT